VRTGLPGGLKYALILNKIKIFGGFYLMKKRIFTLAMVIFVLAAAMLLTDCSEDPTPANRNTPSPNKTDDNSDRDFLSDPTAPTLGDTIVFDNLRRVDT